MLGLFEATLAVGLTALRSRTSMASCRFAENSTSARRFGGRAHRERLQPGGPVGDLHPEQSRVHRGTAGHVEVRRRGGAHQPHEQVAGIDLPAGGFRATALLCLDELYASVAHDVINAGSTDVGFVVLTNARDDQTRDDRRILNGEKTSTIAGTHRLADVIEQYRNSKPPAVAPNTRSRPC